MNALRKLIDRACEMDITEQLNIFNDAILPSEAAAELAAMQEALKAARELFEQMKYDLEADNLTYFVNNGVRLKNDRYEKICSWLAALDRAGAK